MGPEKWRMFVGGKAIRRDEVSRSNPNTCLASKLDDSSKSISW
jgi:hypothetical protein